MRRVLSGFGGVTKMIKRLIEKYIVYIAARKMFLLVYGDENSIKTNHLTFGIWIAARLSRMITRRHDENGR